MAALFYVGGTGTIDGVTNRFATTSGGAASVALPTSADTLTFDAASGGGTVTVGINLNVISVTMGAFTGTLDFGSTSPTMQTFSASGTGTRTLTMGTGVWTITGNATTVWNMATVTNLTFNKGTTPVNFTYSGSTGTRVFSLATGAGYGTSLANSMDVNISAGSDTLSIASSIFGNLSYSGFNGIVNHAAHSIYGNLTLGTGMTLSSGASTITLLGATTKSIASNGVSIPYTLLINSTGGTVSLNDSLSMTGATSALNLSNGVFDTNSNSISVPFIFTSNSNVRSLVLGSSTITLTNTGTVFNAATSTNLTVTPGNSTILISDTSATGKTFAGGGKTYNNLRTSGGTGVVTISGSNTFNNLRTTGPAFLTFTAGTTTTYNSTTISGTTGNLVTLASTGGAYTFAMAGDGVINEDYLSVANCTASVGRFYAGLNSTNAGGNTNVIFAVYPRNQMRRAL